MVKVRLTNKKGKTWVANFKGRTMSTVKEIIRIGNPDIKKVELAGIKKR